jgi:hypothetical protein
MELRSGTRYSQCILHIYLYIWSSILLIRTSIAMPLARARLVALMFMWYIVIWSLIYRYQNHYRGSTGCEIVWACLVVVQSRYRKILLEYRGELAHSSSSYSQVVVQPGFFSASSQKKRAVTIIFSHGFSNLSPQRKAVDNVRISTCWSEPFPIYVSNLDCEAAHRPG